MLTLSLDYNGTTGTNLNSFLTGFVLTDVRDSQASTASIQLCDVDGRFSNGLWAGFVGDVIHIYLSGVDFGLYSIDRISVRRVPRTVTWELVKKPVKTETKKSSKTPTKGSKGIPSGGKLSTANLGWGTLAEGTSLKTLLSRIESHTGVKVGADISKPRKPWSSSSKQMASTNPDVSGMIIPPTDSCLSILNRLSKRFGLVVYSDSSMIRLIEPITTKSQKGTDVSKAPIKAVDLNPSSIINYADSYTITASSLKSDSYSTKDGKRTSVDDETKGSGAGVVSLAYRDTQSLKAEEDLNAFTSTLTIIPTAGLQAGCHIALNGNTYEITKLSYSQSPNTETMAIDLREVA